MAVIAVKAVVTLAVTAALTAVMAVLETSFHLGPLPGYQERSR